MKISILPALLALASGVVTSRSASPRSEVEAVAVVAPTSIAAAPESLAAPAPLVVAAPAARLAAIGAPVPADVKVEVRREGAADVQISVRRKGQVITLRRGDTRVVAAEVASIRLPRGAGDGVPLIWETTAPGSLATTRGLVVVTPLAGKLPSAALRLTAAPTTLASDKGSSHACIAENDGLGGFTVLCRVDAMPFAASLTGATPREGVAVITGEHGMVRLDLPAPESGASAALVGYTDGLNGVVIRAEASRLPGEDHAVVTVVSATRQQPIAPPRRPWERRWIDEEF
jgi:hypothetical protein